MYYHCHYFDDPTEAVLPLIIEMYDCAFVRTEEIQKIAYGINYKSMGLREILTAHGWTALTALCAMILCMFHFPCGTTCLTLRRESGSWRWTAVGMALPALLGVVLCALVRGAASLLGG